MDIKIGIQHVQRELVVDTDDDAATVSASVTAALEAGGLLSLTDTKGRVTLVPVDKLAYVEVGGGAAGAVGFRSV